MYVIGTAGHVDHGKSTLVHTLTGIDPDRLQEEKDRGMTIDLGFAWLTLPSGREISIVDVPGHERFIKNMLAGVGGIDLALLVIAADEGIMPQTEEHLAILELLRVKRAVVALTKKDLVDEEWLALVAEDVSRRIQSSTLADSPILVVSAVTGEGLDDLRAALDRALDETPAREDSGRPRLPIDRVFTVAGFGTIVTGTLIGGKLTTGQELEIQPEGMKTRARGLQMHRTKADEAMPGNRVAINLASLATTDLRRGQVVTIPGWLRPTMAVDANLRVLPNARPLLHNSAATFHSGSAEAVARVTLLEEDEIKPGESGWAQIRLEEPIALAKGDLFVLRSSDLTIGGGEVVEPHARRHRRRQAPVIESLRVLQRGTPEELALQAIDLKILADVGTIAQASGLAADQVRPLLQTLASQSRVVPIGDHYATVASWARLKEQLAGLVADYHRQFPLRLGMPREELKSRSRLSARLFGQVLDALAEAGELCTDETTVRAPVHEVRFTSQQDLLVDQLVCALAKDRYSPPSLLELRASLAVDDEVIGALVEQRRIVKLNDSVSYLPDAYDEMVARIVERARESGSITVAEVRDMFNTSRKYSLAILEHLDERRVTRRVGDTRVLR